MSDPILQIDVAKWVERARDDPVAYRQRQTVEITLNAIAMTTPLNTKMVLKGGILMGLAYDSPRLTTDIDLTTDLSVDNDVDETIRTLLDSALLRAPAALGYADLVVRTHSVKKRPKKKKVAFENAEGPALKLKIAYAQRGTPQENALQQGKAPGIIDVDISFNEPVTQIQVLELTGGQELRAYSLVELIAEKYRAMLQQIPRRRNRRQDVYDLDRLITSNEIDDAGREQILDALITKCRSRSLEPTCVSLDDPEIKKRSGAAWQTMGLELGEVPDFEGCFDRVSKFYRSLPWGSQPTQLGFQAPGLPSGSPYKHPKPPRSPAAAVETDPERRGHVMSEEIFEKLARLDPEDIKSDAAGGTNFAKIRKKDGSTLLHWAVQHGTPEQIEAWVKAGVNPKARDQDGNTALHMAAQNDGPDAVTALLTSVLGVSQQKELANATNANEMTPLHTAVVFGKSSDVVWVLLDVGADPKARDGAWKMALDYAQENDHLKGTPAYWRLNDAHYE